MGHRESREGPQKQRIILLRTEAAGGHDPKAPPFRLARHFDRIRDYDTFPPYVLREHATYSLRLEENFVSHPVCLARGKKMRLTFLLGIIPLGHYLPSLPPGEGIEKIRFVKETQGHIRSEKKAE